ncbi:MAG: rhodanese-like domain-containing protein [Anaerolineae bacterium]|nr:rhodanese-like domain-containing protein [Anaerolineae bacterium]
MVLGCTGLAVKPAAVCVANADAPECRTPVAETEAAPAVADLPPEISPDVVAELLAQGAVTVIDVREDSEYTAGHIAGATLIPLGTLPDQVSEIPTDVPVILVCRSGNRSGQAFQFLRQQGFDNVHNMVGGMNAWQQAGLEIEK